MNDRMAAVKTRYLEHTKIGTRVSIALLEVAALMHIIMTALSDGVIHTDILILILFAILISYLHWVAVKYRIEKGFFGNNAIEARALIEFIKTNGAE